MKVWIVSESECTCCMGVVAVFSTEDKADDYAKKSDSKYVEVDWHIVDEEE